MPCMYRLSKVTLILDEHIEVLPRQKITYAVKALQNSVAQGCYPLIFLKCHRGERRGEFSEADSRRTGPRYVSTHAGTEEGNPEGRGHQSPRSLDSRYPRPCGPGSSQAHPGANLR